MKEGNRMETGKVEKRNDRSWLCGFGLALAEVFALSGNDSAIVSTMRAAGATLASLKEAGLDEYDLKRLRRVKGIPR